MMRSLWISKTGLEAQQTQLDVISNNLANVTTNGFKRSRAVFEDLHVPEPAPGRRAAAASRRSCRPACRSALGMRAGRDRAHLHPGQPAADRQPARRRDQRPGLLPGADARRHDRLHARRLVPGQTRRASSSPPRLHGAARHHDPGRPRRASRSAATARSRVTLPGQAPPQTVGQLQLAELHQPGRPRAARARTCTPRRPRRARRTPARRA